MEIQFQVALRAAFITANRKIKMYKIQSYSCLLLLTLLLVACQEPDRGPEKRPAPIVPTHWRDGTPIAADYPRDHYGVPYRIGNLGGQPVNLPEHSMETPVEYEDSPGFNWRKAENYKPPVRTYKDIIEGFSFFMNYTDGTIYDSWHPNFNKWHEARKEPGTPWILVGIDSGSRYPKREHIYDIYLDGNLNDYAKPPHYIPLDVYAKTGETKFGLEVYANPGVNPENGIAWRNNHGAKDLFVQRDADGHVVSYIKCSNNPVPKPPCDHEFLMSGNDMKVELEMVYDRQNLPHWREIEAQAEKAVRSFIARPPSAAVQQKWRGG